jgi:hypothetical protein
MCEASLYSEAPLPERPTIGWIGSAANLSYLTAIAPALTRVVRRFPDTTIAVCCDKPPDLSHPQPRSFNVAARVISRPV